MAADYDLVIFGGSEAARYAAVRASQWGARVALVEPYSASEPPDQQTIARLYHHHLIQLGQSQPYLQQASWFTTASKSSSESASEAVSPLPPKLHWQRSTQWVQGVAAAMTDYPLGELSLPLLATVGVDVVVTERAAFCRRPHLALTTTERVLRGRAYLLAPDLPTPMPQIDGLSQVQYFTPQTFWQQSQWPDRLIIVGGTPGAIELAQACQRWGAQVTLIVAGDRLLPREDPEMSFWVQAYLEADGVKVLTQTSVTQVKQLENQIWIQAGHQALATSALLVDSPPTWDLRSLNLEAAAVKWHPQGIPVNRKLQTTHPRIYACGDILGGYSLPHLARHEAEVALHNLLFFPRTSIRYEAVPWVLMTDPAFARIGFSATQARASWGDEVLVLRQEFSSNLMAQLTGQTSGFCQFVVRRNGELLGAQLMGAGVNEWMAPIALALKHRLTLLDLATLPLATPALAAIIHQTARQWHSLRLHPWQRTWMETWLDWRRGRSS